jgi:hypothetical protein
VWAEDYTALMKHAERIQHNACEWVTPILSLETKMKEPIALDQYAVAG